MVNTYKYLEHHPGFVFNQKYKSSISQPHFRIYRYKDYSSSLTEKLAPHEQPCSALGFSTILKAALISSV